MPADLRMALSRSVCLFAEAEEFSQSCRRLLAVKAAGGYVHGQCLPCIRVELLLRQRLVLAQKHQARRQCRPFVAIGKAGARQPSTVPTNSWLAEL